MAPWLGPCAVQLRQDLERLVKLAGMIRVSTEGQVDAYGKEIQDDAIRKWAEMTGNTIVEMFEEDAVSGKVDGGDRPVLASLLLRADEFDGIVFFDATRIARRLFVQETLLALVWNAGLKVFTTTAGEIDEHDDDPTRILIRQVLGAVAEFDHRNIVRRLHNGRRAKAAAGGFAGGTARYGLRVVGNGKAARYEPDELEYSVMKEVRQRHDNGESLRTIASSLNRRQIMTKRGKQWGPEQVARLVR